MQKVIVERCSTCGSLAMMETYTKIVDAKTFLIKHKRCLRSEGTWKKRNKACPVVILDQKEVI